MLVSQDLAVAGATLFLVTFVATGAIVISRLELLPRALSGSLFLLQPGSVLRSMVHVTTGCGS